MRGGGNGASVRRSAERTVAQGVPQSQTAIGYPEDPQRRRQIAPYIWKDCVSRNRIDVTTLDAGQITRYLQLFDPAQAKWAERFVTHPNEALGEIDGIINGLRNQL